eukprot:15023466-Ditylum_brightwellii.AAC.1
MELWHQVMMKQKIFAGNVEQIYSYKNHWIQHTIIPTNVATLNSFASPKENIMLSSKNLIDGLHMLNRNSFLAHTTVPSVDEIFGNENYVGSPA